MTKVRLYNLLKAREAEEIKQRYPKVYDVFGPGHGYRSFLKQMQLIKERASKKEELSTEERLRRLKLT